MNVNEERKLQKGRPGGQAKERHLFYKNQTSQIAVNYPPVRHLRKKILINLRRALRLNLISEQRKKIKRLMQKIPQIKSESQKKKNEEKLKKRKLHLNGLLKYEKKRSLLLRKQRFKKLARQRKYILFLKRRKFLKVKRIVGLRRKKFLQAFSRISANEILPKEPISFRVFSKMFTKRKVFNKFIEKTILAHRFNKYYANFLASVGGIFTLNSYVLPWFKPVVAFHKKRRFFGSTMLWSLLRKYYVRPDHLRTKRGLRAWILFTPVLRVSRKIIMHDLSSIYPKKINVLFKLDL